MWGSGWKPDVTEGGEPWELTGVAFVSGKNGRGNKISIVLVIHSLDLLRSILFVPEGKAGGQGISIALVIHSLDPTLQRLCRARMITPTGVVE